MKKKMMVFLMTMAMTAGLMTVCGSSDSSADAGDKGSAKTETKSEKKDDDDIKIGYVCKDLSQTWFIQVTDVLKAEAEKLGAEVIMADTAMNPETYLTAVDNMIAQGVDVLIVCPPDQDLSQTTVAKCEEAGIKVFADADGLIDENGVHIAPALELDAYKVGTAQGEWVADYIKENKLDKAEDAMYLCMTMDTISSCVPRADGAYDSIMENVPGFPENRVVKADYDGTSEMGYEVVAATVTAHPEVKYWIVTAPNEEGAQGAARAMESIGVDKDAVVTGLGGYLAKDEFKKDASCFKASGYFMASEDGKAIAEAAVNWAKDDSKIPFEEYKEDGEDYGVYPLGAVMVTKDDYEEIMGEDAK